MCDAGYYFLAPAGCVLQVVDTSAGQTVRFSMSVNIPGDQFEVSRFQEALHNFSESMTTQDWDTLKFSSAAIQADIVENNPSLGAAPATAPESSSKAVAGAVAVTVVVGGALVALVLYWQRSNAGGDSSGLASGAAATVEGDGHHHHHLGRANKWTADGKTAWLKYNRDQLTV